MLSILASPPSRRAPHSAIGTRRLASLCESSLHQKARLRLLHPTGRHRPLRSARPRRVNDLYRHEHCRSAAAGPALVTREPHAPLIERRSADVFSPAELDHAVFGETPPSQALPAALVCRSTHLVCDRMTLLHTHRPPPDLNFNVPTPVSAGRVQLQGAAHLPPSHRRDSWHSRDPDLGIRAARHEMAFTATALPFVSPNE